MKNLIFELTWVATWSISPIYGQMSPEKKHDFLKNYKAPDFKQRRFDAMFYLNAGRQINEGPTVNLISESSSLGYSQYSNQQDYQGLFGISLLSNLSFSKLDSLKNFNANNSVVFNTENRFYFKPKWFFGAYGNAYVRHSYYELTNQDRSLNYSVGFSPTVAIGYGRLEPIQYARNAMDIEIMLGRGNRLSNSYTVDQLTVIADRLAEINNVRFYDFRLRRIEQFEALDETLKGIGGINEFDMTYFSYLADAYLYAQNFQRFSGFRNEIGITNATDLRYNAGLDKHNNVVRTALYYNLSYNLPTSYMVQHTVFANGFVGGSHYDVSDSPTGNSFEEDAALIAGYELGLYPTTRTNFNFGAKGGLHPAHQGGYAAEVYANGSVYLSPQFRLSFEANYSPNNKYYDHLYTSMPILGTNDNSFGLGGFIRLNYAIF